MHLPPRYLYADVYIVELAEKPAQANCKGPFATLSQLKTLSHFCNALQKFRGPGQQPTLSYFGNNSSETLLGTGRLDSNSQASTTGRDVPEYDSQGYNFQPEEDASFRGEETVRDELVSCTTIEDVLEVLVEESGEVTGSLVVDALLRFVASSQLTWLFKMH